MSCQPGYLVFPHPFLSPPHLVENLVSLLTHNSTTGGIVKEGVLILDVVPGDTKKAEGQLILVTLS